MALEYITQFDEMLELARAPGRVDPTAVCATSFEELETLLKHSQDTIGYPDPQEFIAHEREHLAAAKVIGVSEFVFALVVNPWTPQSSWGRGVGVQGAVIHRFTKTHTDLMRASVCGFPRILSDQDVDNVSSLGFTIEALAEAAKRANEINGEVVIPVPLSIG